MNEYFKGLIEDLSSYDTVEVITLGGSRATGFYDVQSDYDVYVYWQQPIPSEERRQLTDRYCSYMEIGNTYYELEDDGILKDGTVIELIYRKLDEFDCSLKTHMIDFVAYGGYTTCFYDNLLASKVLFDRNGDYHKICQKYNSYPLELAENIVRKNRELLSGKVPSLDRQIIKAFERKDYPSINHRIAEFLASYFDLVYAYNRVPHPGEKRMIELAVKKCAVIPENMEHDVVELITSANEDSEVISELLVRMIAAVDQMLK